jgi:hypothetical protein
MLIWPLIFRWPILSVLDGPIHINHLEHGRLDLNPEIIHKLLIAYGYSYEEFIKFQDPKNDLPEAIRHECMEIIRRLSFEKLKTVKAILQSF